jgi:hypothetical protein
VSDKKGGHEVLETLQHLEESLGKIEATIDKIGDDFSVQKFDLAEYVLWCAVLRPQGADRMLLFLFLYHATVRTTSCSLSTSHTS